MSKKNRKMMYDKLVKEGRLSQDDGALVAEFGELKKSAKSKVEEKEKVK